LNFFDTALDVFQGELIFPRVFVSLRAAVLNQQVIVIGGRDDGGNNRDEVFQYEEGKWSKMDQNLERGRYRHAIAEVNLRDVCFANGATGGSVVVSVTVMNAATSGVLSGARVEITLGSWNSSGTTDKKGKVSFTVSPQAPIGSTGVIKTSHKDFITQADSRLIQDKPNSFKIYLQSSLPTPEVGEVLGAASVAVILKVQSSTNSAALAGANVQFYFGGVEYNGQTNAQGSLIIGLRPDAPFGQSALITVSLAGYTTKVEFYVINSTPPLQGITILLVPGGNGRYYG